MMEFSQLKELMDLFSKSQIDKIDLEHEGLRLKMSKHEHPVTVVERAPVAAAPVAAAPQPAPVAAAEPEDDNLIYVTSPIVGTYYRSPNPNAEPFVQVGDTVKPGQTLCIVEAMKLMNEIQAESAGVVAKLIAENGEGVEFGQNLIALKPL